MPASTPAQSPENSPREPIAPPLDDLGHIAAGYDSCSMWHIAAYVPDGSEGEVAKLLAGNGIEVYRMWRN